MSFQEVLDLFLKVEKHYIIIKRDIKDAFCNIPIDHIISGSEDLY